MPKNVTLKKALSIPCKHCGTLPVISDDWKYNGGLCLILCPNCGTESLAGCRRHYATNSWADMNTEAK